MRSCVKRRKQLSLASSARNSRSHTFRRPCASARPVLPAISETMDCERWRIGSYAPEPIIRMGRRGPPAAVVPSIVNESAALHRLGSSCLLCAADEQHHDATQHSVTVQQAKPIQQSSIRSRSPCRRGTRCCGMTAYLEYKSQHRESHPSGSLTLTSTQQQANALTCRLCMFIRQQTPAKSSLELGDSEAAEPSGSPPKEERRAQTGTANVCEWAGSPPRLRPTPTHTALDPYGVRPSVSAPRKRTVKYQSVVSQYTRWNGSKT